jgi:hypothetical protein
MGRFHAAACIIAPCLLLSTGLVKTLLIPADEFLKLRKLKAGRLT